MPKFGWNRRRKNPGRESAERVDGDLGVGGRTGDAIIGGEQSLSFAAEQQRADYRQVAEHRIQRIGRHDRALQVEAVAAEIDVTVGGHADRLPVGKEALECQMVVGIGKLCRARC